MANLEMQLTFQEDTIESLNKLVTEQTQQMTEMQRVKSGGWVSA